MILRGCDTCLEGIGQVLTGIFTALKRHPDNDTPRTSPPLATPVDFPRCEPTSEQPGNRNTYDLVKLFSGIHKGPRLEHLEALNLNVESNIPLEKLVPAEHLPPRSWLQAPTLGVDSTAQPILVNGGSLPAQEVFYARAKELDISNDNGYRTIHRVPLAKKEGPIRLLFLRKFWEELDCIADYWDTSQDNYIKSQVGSRKGSDNVALDVDQLRQMAQDESKKVKQDRSGDMNTKMQETTPNQNNSSSSGAPMKDVQNVTDRNDTPMPDADSALTSDVPPTHSTTDSTLYTGHRTSTGSLMPPHHLERALFTFLDAIALPFRLRLSEPRSQPRLQLGPLLLLPLPHMASVLRIPLEPTRARQGWREGPLLGAVSAEYAVWRENGKNPGDSPRERLQLLKEVGCVLLLAQRRAMEGKEEIIPGKGKWWAENPRWGGRSGIAIYKEPLPPPPPPPLPPTSITAPAGAAGTSASMNNDSEVQMPSTKAEPSLIEAQRKRVKRARRQQQQENQQQRLRNKGNILTPPSSLWERNVQYARIGMDRESDFDDIYLLSSLNHHLSIIHARVHTRYIEFLTHCVDDEEKRKEMEEADWWELRMQRSRWFDLLDPNDRVEAMRGVWGVLSWIGRER